jgi:hypothetical protein
MFVIKIEGDGEAVLTATYVVPNGTLANELHIERPAPSTCDR